jgi:hypothetical protein
VAGESGTAAKVAYGTETIECPTLEPGSFEEQRFQVPLDAVFVVDVFDVADGLAYGSAYKRDGETLILTCGNRVDHFEVRWLVPE